MSEKLDGTKFGRLTAIKVVGRTTDNRPAWLCQCECGAYVTISEHNLKRGNTKSCGCYKKDVYLRSHYRHGLCGTRLYRVWTNMRSRCDRKANSNYRWYGGRGISYDKTWSVFSNFAEWALSHGYEDGLELDRIDVNGNYEPLNCRFITHKENCKNRRNNNAKDTLEKVDVT